MKKICLIISLLIYNISPLLSVTPTHFNDQDATSIFAAIDFPLSAVTKQSDPFLYAIFTEIDKTFGKSGISLDSYQINMIKKTYLYLVFLAKLEKIKNGRFKKYQSDFAEFTQDNLSQMPHLPTEQLITSVGWGAVTITNQDLINSQAWQLFCKSMITDIYVYYSVALQTIHNVEKQTFNYIPHFETSFYNQDYTNLRTINEITRTRIVLEGVVKQRYLNDCPDWNALANQSQVKKAKGKKTQDPQVLFGKTVVTFIHTLFYQATHDMNVLAGNNKLNSPLKEQVWCYFMLHEVHGQLTKFMTDQNISTMLDVISSSKLALNIFPYKTDDFVLLDELLAAKSKAEGTNTNSIHPSPKNFHIEDIRPLEQLPCHERSYDKFVKKQIANRVKKEVQVQSFWSDLGHDFVSLGDGIANGVEDAATAVGYTMEAAGIGIAGLGASLVATVGTVLNAVGIDVNTQGIQNWATGKLSESLADFNQSAKDLEGSVDNFASGLENGIIAPFAEIGGTLAGYILDDQKIGTDITGVINQVADVIVNVAAEASNFLIETTATTGDIYFRTVQVAAELAQVIADAAWAISSTQGQQAFLKDGEDLGKTCLRAIVQTFTGILSMTKEALETLLHGLTAITNALTTLFIDLSREITYLILSGRILALVFGGPILGSVFLVAGEYIPTGNQFADQARDVVSNTLNAHRQTINQVWGVAISLVPAVAAIVMSGGTAAPAVVAAEAAMIGTEAAATTATTVTATVTAETAAAAAQAAEEAATAAAQASAQLTAKEAAVQAAKTALSEATPETEAAAKQALLAARSAYDEALETASAATQEAAAKAAASDAAKEAIAKNLNNIIAQANADVTAREAAIRTAKVALNEAMGTDGETAAREALALARSQYDEALTVASETIQAAARVAAGGTATVTKAAIALGAEGAVAAATAGTVVAGEAGEAAITEAAQAIEETETTLGEELSAQVAEISAKEAIQAAEEETEQIAEEETEAAAKATGTTAAKTISKDVAKKALDAAIRETRAADIAAKNAADNAAIKMAAKQAAKTALNRAMAASPVDQEAVEAAQATFDRASAEAEQATQKAADAAEEAAAKNAAESAARQAFEDAPKYLTRLAALQGEAINIVMNVGFGLFNIVGGFNQDQNAILTENNQAHALKNLWKFINENKLSTAQNQLTYLQELQKKQQAEIGNQTLALALYQNLIYAGVDKTQRQIRSALGPQYVQLLTPDSTNLLPADIGNSWGIATNYLDLYPSQGFFTTTTGRPEFPFAQEIAQAPLAAMQQSASTKKSAPVKDKLWFNQRAIALDLQHENGAAKKPDDILTVQMDIQYIYTLKDIQTSPTANSGFYVGLYLGGNYHNYTSRKFLARLLNTTVANLSQQLATFQTYYSSSNFNADGSMKKTPPKNLINLSLIDIDQAHLAKMFVLYSNSATDALSIGVYEHEGLGWILQQPLPASLQLDQQHTYQLKATLDGTSLTIELFADNNPIHVIKQTVTVTQISNQRTYGIICDGAAIQWNQVIPKPLLIPNGNARPAATPPIPSEVSREQQAKIDLAKELNPKFGNFNLASLSKRRILAGQYIYNTMDTDLQKIDPKATDFVVFATMQNDLITDIGKHPSKALTEGQTTVLVSLVTGMVYDENGKNIAAVSDVWKNYEAPPTTTTPNGHGPFPAILGNHIAKRQNIVAKALSAINFGKFVLDIISPEALQSGQYIYQSTQTINAKDSTGKPMIDYLVMAEIEADNSLGYVGMSPISSNAQGLLSLVTGNLYRKNTVFAKGTTPPPITSTNLPYLASAMLSSYASQANLSTTSPDYITIVNAETVYENYLTAQNQPIPTNSSPFKIIPITKTTSKSISGIHLPLHGLKIGLNKEAPGIHLHFPGEKSIDDRQQSAAGNPGFQHPKGGVHIKL